MEMKAILTDSKSITFNPIEGKEYTKHKYTLRRYTDAEYIEDVINEAEDYEMDEKDYKAVSVLYVDDKPIIKILSKEYEEALDIVVNSVFPELRPVKNELDIFGEYRVRHQFPYDTLTKDGKWVEEVTNFDTEDTDIHDINHTKICEIDTGEDKVYHVNQIPKFDENGVYAGYGLESRRICKFEFYTSLYNTMINYPIMVEAKDEHNNKLGESAMYGFKDSFDVASELIKSTTPALLDKYSSMISNVFNTKELLRSNIFQKFRTAISEILDSLKDTLFNIEHSTEHDVKLSDKAQRTSCESRLDAYKKNKAASLLNKKMKEYKQETDTNLNMTFYSYVDGEDKLYREVKDIIKDEVLEVISIEYLSNKDNNTYSYYGMNDNKNIYITKDNRIFISTNILSNIFSNIEILNNIPEKTFFEMIESLGLSILMNTEYDLYKIDHMMYNLYWEITSSKQMMTRTIKSLLGSNFNIRTDEVLEYVKELKNIVKEVNDIVNNK